MFSRSRVPQPSNASTSAASRTNTGGNGSAALSDPAPAVGKDETVCCDALALVFALVADTWLAAPVEPVTSDWGALNGGLDG